MRRADPSTTWARASSGRSRVASRRASTASARLAVLEQGLPQAGQGQLATGADARGDGEEPDRLLGTVGGQQLAPRSALIQKSPRCGDWVLRRSAIAVSRRPRNVERSGQPGHARLWQVVDVGRGGEPFQDFQLA